MKHLVVSNLAAEQHLPFTGEQLPPRDQTAAMRLARAREAVGPFATVPALLGGPRLVLGAIVAGAGVWVS